MIDDERFIIEEESNSEVETSEVSSNRFPIKTQLFLIAGMLLLIFTSFITPKAIALFSNGQNQAEVHTSAIDTNKDNLSNNPKKITGVNVRAESAYVWDVVGQRALYEKNQDEVLPLASITKLMTALVAYELVSDETLVTVSNAAAAQQSGGGFSAGEKFKAKELADFALISSYNSAAYTLAASVGELLGDQDPVSQFIAAMNIKADELNLQTLDYKNPTGLDESLTVSGAYGSARDTSYLVEYIILNRPEILAPTVTEYTKLYNKNGDHHEAHNTNSILSEIPNLIGSKTGYTDLAGGNLTIAFDAGYNRPVIITVLGSTISERFTDVKKLVAAVQASMVNEE